LGIPETLVPETLPGVVVVTIGDIAGADVTKGVAGIVGAIARAVGATPIVGTAAAELTPRLLISVESRGIPTRGAPPGVVGVVGAEEAVTLFEPAPHIPDIPDVSIVPDGVAKPELCNIPEVVDIPDVAEIVADMLDDGAVPPAMAPVAGIETPTDTPPPSKLLLEPAAVPRVEHGVVLPGIAMVPVGLAGSGLVPGDVISVAPSAIPVGPIGWPEMLLSGEVVPTVAVGSTMPPTCAAAALQRRSMVKPAMMNERFTDILRFEQNGALRSY
jgi:hypothetical protein